MLQSMGLQIGRHDGVTELNSLSAIRVVSSAYLMLLIFLPTILIPACAEWNPGSSSLAFCMIHSACRSF